LEFELAADIVRTAIAPNWQQIGQLAAIAAIRTLLNYFLQQEIDRAAKPQSASPAHTDDVAARPALAAEAPHVAE
jgi:lipase chaperone LimK